MRLKYVKPERNKWALLWLSALGGLPAQGHSITYLTTVYEEVVLVGSYENTVLRTFNSKGQVTTEGDLVPELSGPESVCKWNGETGYKGYLDLDPYDAPIDRFIYFSYSITNNSVRETYFLPELLEMLNEPENQYVLISAPEKPQEALRAGAFQMRVKSMVRNGDGTPFRTFSGVMTSDPDRLLAGKATWWTEEYDSEQVRDVPCVYSLFVEAYSPAEESDFNLISIVTAWVHGNVTKGFKNTSPKTKSAAIGVRG